jgi:hypothetical protein
MISSTAHKPLIVHTADGAGPYIIVPLDQLESVASILQMYGISFWEDFFAVSVDGKPEVVFVNFGRSGNAAQVQRVLDAAA